MEEREKQRLEQEELEREKALLARKAKAKRHLDDNHYGRVEQKKAVLDDRSRHVSSYADSSV